MKLPSTAAGLALADCRARSASLDECNGTNEQLHVMRRRTATLVRRIEASVNGIRADQ
jgi:hypothetical protein